MNKVRVQFDDDVKVEAKVELCKAMRLGYDYW